jgi:hypothetical protein
MKLTDEQLQVLQIVLSGYVKYKETYEEVYDHVLTALENSDNSKPLEEAINIILLNDFGGFAGLRLLERKRRWAAERQVLAKQGHYLINYFKWPLLPVTIAIYWLIYYLIANFNFGFNGMFLLVSTIIIGNVCTRFRMFRMGYIFKKYKKSINDLPFWIITLVPFGIYMALNILIKIIFFTFYYQYNFREFHHIHEFLPVYSLLITLYIIYNISVIKLHKDEFKRLGTIN